MANFIFGGDDVEARTGGGTPRLASEGTLVEVFTDAAGTTAATGFRAYPSGDALVDIRVNALSQLPYFYLQADALDTLYVRINNGPLTRINARADERIDAALVRITAVETSLTGISGVLYLGTGQPVPPGTPAGTLIVRPA